jgi:DNA-binding transcriptional regulator YiaG
VVATPECVMPNRKQRRHPLPLLPGVIKARRTELGMSQDHLAELVNVDQTAIARWEAGTRVPAGHHLFVLMKLFRITPDEIA